MSKATEIKIHNHLAVFETTLGNGRLRFLEPTFKLNEVIRMPFSDSRVSEVLTELGYAERSIAYAVMALNPEYVEDDEENFAAGRPYHAYIEVHVHD